MDEQDNKTLTELHETSKYYKELYIRVGNFYRMVYKILGFYLRYFFFCVDEYILD